MPEVTPSAYITGIVMFTLVMVGFISIYTSFTVENPALITDDLNYFSERFNKTAELTASVNSLETNITDANPEQGTYGVIGGLINSAWGSLRLLFNSFSFMDDILRGLTTVFGVPAWIISIILLLITIMLSFAIYSLVFQRST